MVLIGLGIAAWPRVEFFLLTRRFAPVSKIETLRSPVAVLGWSANGLELADGRTIRAPDFTTLPKESTALAEITKRGVEIDGQGRLYGLVRVHHWCGNDPVREHIARVDISAVLIYFREKERSSDDEDPASSSFSEWGWNVSDFHAFQWAQPQ